MRRIDGLDELERSVGEELGVLSWSDVTPERLDTFAEGRSYGCRCAGGSGWFEGCRSIGEQLVER